LDTPKIPALDVPAPEGLFMFANRSYRPARLLYRRSRFGDDQRLKYLLYFLDLRGLRTLELGPLTGYHSIILEKLGVRESVAVEGREDNYRLCLQVKERYQLERTTFVHQNIEAIYSGQEPAAFTGSFDVALCLGVLYHLPDPARALEWLRTQAPTLFLATHYFEPAEAKRYRSDKFTDASYRHRGRAYRVKQYREGGLEDPHSGLSRFSLWPYEEDLIRMLEDAGYNEIHLLGRDLHNQKPHLTLLADARVVTHDSSAPATYV
jgi:SAM-dependent methyltransferase